MAVYLLPTSALEEHARVAHHSTCLEPFVLERRDLRKQAVQGVRDVQRPASVQNVVDGVTRFKAALYHGHIPLCIQEVEDVLPLN